MTDLDMKDRLLEDAGYIYKPSHEIYINRKTKKAFSIDFIEDHDSDLIATKIHEVAPPNEWTFVFNSEPSDSVKRELSRLLDA